MDCCCMEGSMNAHETEDYGTAGISTAQYRLLSKGRSTSLATETTFDSTSISITSDVCDNRRRHMCGR